METLTSIEIVGAASPGGQEDGPCRCAAPGHCPRYGRYIGGRLFDICRGEAPGLDEATCRAYREQWAFEALAGPSPAQPAVKTCRSLGRRARHADRSVKKRDCGEG